MASLCSTPLGSTTTTHPLAGSILVLTGKIQHHNAFPCVVILPPEAFDDPIEWPTSSILSIADVYHETTALLTPDKELTTSYLYHHSCYCYLSTMPALLLTLFKLAMEAYNNVNEDTQHMCFHTIQFLLAALTYSLTTDTINPTCQLGLHFDVAQMDPTITQWAMACYNIYNLHIANISSTQPHTLYHKNFRKICSTFHAPNPQQLYASHQPDTVIHLTNHETPTPINP